MIPTIILIVVLFAIVTIPCLIVLAAVVSICCVYKDNDNDKTQDANFLDIQTKMREDEILV